MGQNQQFEDVTRALKLAKDALDPARRVLVLELVTKAYKHFTGCATMTSSPPLTSSQLVPISASRRASRYTMGCKAEN